MIKLNKLTDYAIVMLVCLHQEQGHTAVWTAASVARKTGVPLPTVSKLIKMLVHANLLKSQRGAAGGCALARPAEDISVAAVIRSIEGPVTLTDCMDGSTRVCQVEDACPMHSPWGRSNWSKVNQAIGHALESVSIADMAISEQTYSPLPASPPTVLETDRV